MSNVLRTRLGGAPEVRDINNSERRRSGMGF